jgi:hypothetical protein
VAVDDRSAAQANRGFRTCRFRAFPFDSRVKGVSIVQEGIPAAIPAEACYLGWQESLALLTQLVEPEIPG